MIGDGANDCAAIKQANIGMSFTSADSSYSSPFSIDSESISIVKEIII